MQVNVGSLQNIMLDYDPDNIRMEIGAMRRKIPPTFWF